MAWGRGVASTRKQRTLVKHELLEVVELAVHLQDSHVVAEELVGAVGELDARVGAGQLLAARRPLDRRALVEEVGRVEVRLALLLDELHLEDFALLLVRN